MISHNDRFQYHMTVNYITSIGILTSMEQLPVMELAFGDSARRYSFIYYELGDFKCYGKKNMYPSEILVNDFAFKAAGDPG